MHSDAEADDVQCKVVMNHEHSNRIVVAGGDRLQEVVSGQGYRVEMNTRAVLG